MKPRPRRNDAAITLVETLVAMTVLAIVLAAVASGLALALRLERSSAEREELAALAENHLGAIRAEWRDPTAFEARSVPGSPDAWANCTVDIADPDDRAEPIRLRVTVRCSSTTTPGADAVQLVLDIPDPR